jgi:predicted NUDIX family NTP pyrophosphohydrolase
MPKTSAGLLMYRWREKQIEVLLVHPGGPLWRNKDEGAWTIPKGEVNPGEDLLATALREFEEETGLRATGQVVPLTAIKQKSGKIVHALAVEGDLDITKIKSNTFTMEWPPRSGKQADFPEVDRGEFFDVQTARTKMNPYQLPLLDELTTALKRMKTGA